MKNDTNAILLRWAWKQLPTEDKAKTQTISQVHVFENPSQIEIEAVYLGNYGDTFKRKYFVTKPELVEILNGSAD